MKRYDELVLNKLLDKYEGSSVYLGRNRRAVPISFPLRKNMLPEYFDEGSLQFSVIHEQLEEAERKGFLRLVWKNNKKGHILEKCVLEETAIDTIYVWLHRIPKSEKEEKLQTVIRESQGQNPLLDRFLDFLKERMENGESVAQYADLNDPETLVKLCFLIRSILENKKERFLREFSIIYDHDSKTAEREIGKAAAIIRQFWENRDYEELETEQLLEEFGIFRNPSWVMLKGYGSFRLGNGEVDLEKLKGGIGISSQDIADISWNKDCAPKRILTIENLTSFHRFQEEGTLCIYLGGYHNRAKREFLKGIYWNWPQAEYGHFGDIDCGGFRIYQDLCQKTGIPFETRWMNEEIYEAYMEYGKRLTDYDRKELLRMKEDIFFIEQIFLFDRMLQCGRKVEQECVRTEEKNK